MLMSIKKVVNKNRTNGEIDLQQENSKEQWERISINNFKVFNNNSIQQNVYKIQQRWYNTPEVLNKTYPDVVNKCWRCDEIGVPVLDPFRGIVKK